MNDKDKIIEIAKVEFDIQFGCGDYIEIGDKEAFADSLADALIENGIGDIAEWKKRAEIAEKEREEYRNSNRIVLRGLEIIKRNILRYCATDFPNILQQAEKELQEERKQ